MSKDRYQSLKTQEPSSRQRITRPHLQIRWKWGCCCLTWGAWEPSGLLEDPSEPPGVPGCSVGNPRVYRLAWEGGQRTSIEGVRVCPLVAEEADRVQSHSCSPGVGDGHRGRASPETELLPPGQGWGGLLICSFRSNGKESHRSRPVSDPRKTVTSSA